MATEERDRILYPVDNKLIQEAQSVGSGMHVHDINRAIANYRYHIEQWEKHWKAYKWYDAVKAERELRGIVVEAKMGKSFHAPWATRPYVPAGSVDKKE